MPTKKRISVPGACVHVMARGIDGRKIFADDTDRRVFCRLLGKVITTSGYLCYGWSLMDNHYHLVLRCSDTPLEHPMRTLNSAYARHFNDRIERSGYVFQDRYKSVLTQDQNYLQELIRYVHLKPLRGGLCGTIEQLDCYPWAGHAVLMGNHSVPFQTTEAVLKRFGSTPKGARERYREFIVAGAKKDISNPLDEMIRRSNQGVDKKDKPECWVIGDPDFVRSVMSRHRQRLLLSRARTERWDLENLCDQVAREEGVNVGEMKIRTRAGRGSVARKKFCYIACRVLQFPIAEVAAFLKVSAPAVSWSVTKGGQLVEKALTDKFTNLSPG